MKKFLFDCTIATLFVFAVLIGIREISQLSLFNAFDPIGQSLADMEFTDITFSRLRVDPLVDESIVLVNISDIPRGMIAQQVMTISKFKPKVIGIDGFFDCVRCGPGKIDSSCCPLAYDTLNNLILANAIKDAGNVVLVTKLLQTDSLVQASEGSEDFLMYDSLRRTDAFIRGDAMEGFASLETEAANQEDLKSCRRFNPKMEVRNKMQYAFAVKMAMVYDSVKTKKFLDRGNSLEVINYRGNIWDPFEAGEFPGRYATLEWDQALNEDSFVPELFKDKIVIMGYLGNTLDDTSWDDKFFTPLNKKYAGKSRPDMYGAVVHANAVSMILNEDYVGEMNVVQQGAIAFIICFLNIALFTFINNRIPHWFDGLSLLVQLIEIVICGAAMIFVFKWFSFKLNLTIALAAIALCGTCFELYINVVKRLFLAIRNNKWLTRKTDEVLTE